MSTVHLSLRWFELARGWRIGRGQNGPRVIDALAAPRSDVTASNSTQQEPGELARFCFLGAGLWALAQIELRQIRRRLERTRGLRDDGILTSRV